MLRAHRGRASHVIAPLAAAVALVTGLLAPPVEAAPDSDKAKAVPGELIVRFKQGVTADTRSSARDVVKGRLQQRLPVDGMQLVSLPAGTAPSDAARRMKRQRGVVYAEPNWTRHAMGLVNDTYFPMDWGLNNTGQTINGLAGTADADIDAPEAWDVTSGDPTMTVGVIDTGVDGTHPDLSSKVVAGWDFVDNDNDPTDMNGHGTHVSGTIAAAGNDATGVAGVAYGSKVMPLRVLDASGSGSVSDVIAAYGYAAQHGIRVVNASLGSSASSRAESDAIAGAPNTLFVVAAGNGGADGVGDNVDQTPDYPCAYPLDNIVCVGATDSSDQLAPFSNFGTVGVDIAAPGVNVASDWPQALGGPYAYLDGTSMATPHASGVAALVASRFPTATAAELRTSVLNGADQPPALAGKIAGGRRLNAYGAVTGLAPPPDTTPPPGDTTPAPSDATPPPIASDTTAPIVSVKVAGRASAKALRRGLSVLVGCSEACRIDARLTGPKTARASSLGHSIRSLGSAGRTRLKVRPTRAVRRKWSRIARRGRRLALAFTVRDRAGNIRRVQKSVRVVR